MFSASGSRKTRVYICCQYFFPLLYINCGIALGCIWRYSTKNLVNVWYAPMRQKCWLKCDKDCDEKLYTYISWKHKSQSWISRYTNIRSLPQEKYLETHWDRCCEFDIRLSQVLQLLDWSLSRWTVFDCICLECALQHFLGNRSNIPHPFDDVCYGPLAAPSKNIFLGPSPWVIAIVRVILPSMDWDFPNSALPSSVSRDNPMS